MGAGMLSGSAVASADPVQRAFEAIRPYEPEYLCGPRIPTCFPTEPRVRSVIMSPTSPSGQELYAPVEGGEFRVVVLIDPVS